MSGILMQGEWSTGTVYLDGIAVQVDDQGSGFSWGSHGGPSIRLAYAILLGITSALCATRNCEAFSREVIAGLPQMDFRVTIDIGRWLETHERKLKSKRRSR